MQSFMTRPPVDIDRLRSFLERLGRGSSGAGSVFVVGGGSAIFYGWRASTVDVDLKLDPEPPGAFELIRRLKDELAINIELASPDHFIPPVSGWRERSVFIACYGEVNFYHYDFYTQALAKIERGSARDLADVHGMIQAGLVELARLSWAFDSIQSDLVRYPGIDEQAFRAKFDAAIEIERRHASD
jgi:hypothetical protein